MKRLLSIVATLSVLAAAAPIASAQYDTTSTNRTGTSGTMSNPNNTGTMSTDESMPRTAGPLPLIAIVGALLMIGGIREGMRRRTNG